MMALRSRLDVLPGTTKCRCGYDLGSADTSTPSSTLVKAQAILDRAMDGQPVDLAGDPLDPRAFFVVFRTLADLIRLTGYDLDGNRWSDPQSRQRPIGTLNLGAVQAILDRTGKVFTLTPEGGEASIRELRHRAEAQSIQVTWRIRKHRLEPSRIGRIGRILSS